MISLVLNRVALVLQFYTPNKTRTTQAVFLCASTLSPPHPSPPCLHSASRAQVGAVAALERQEHLRQAVVLRPEVHCPAATRAQCDFHQLLHRKPAALRVCVAGIAFHSIQQTCCASCTRAQRAIGSRASPTRTCHGQGPGESPCCPGRAVVRKASIYTCQLFEPTAHEVGHAEELDPRTALGMIAVCGAVQCMRWEQS